MKIDSPIIEKVKNALMSIQRRSWEQGECMQAMLELRDYDTMITLAREASYICLDDGRTTLTTDWEKGTVTDTCACGEALMLAAKLTGDKLITKAYNDLLHYTLHHKYRNADEFVDTYAVVNKLDDFAQQLCSSHNDQICGERGYCYR